MPQNRILREEDTLLIQCSCYALDFLSVWKGLEENDFLSGWVEIYVTVSPISLWERLQAVWRAWSGHRYISGDCISLSPETVKELVDFLGDDDAE